MGDVVLVKYVANADETKVENGVTVTTETTVDVKSINTDGDEGIVPVEAAGDVQTGDHSEKEACTEKNAEMSTEETTDVTVVAEEATEEKTVEVTEGTAEVTIEQPEQKVILYQFPPGENVPNLSPFCLKLETFLRINSIPYENQYGYKMGKKGKLPWIEYKGERIADSNLIIKYLNDKFEVDLDKNFTSEQVALGRAARSMLEENTYWVLIYNRYAENFNEYKKLTSPPTGTGIGFNITQKMFQRKMRSNLDAQGMGRHSKEEIYAIGQCDLKTISDILGDKEFLLGSTPTTFDCSVFGLCANVLYAGLESPLTTFMKENASNLCEFCDRMKSLYWKNWDSVLSVRKSEPVKKTFTFKKKAHKPSKTKDSENEDTDNKEETAADSTVDTLAVDGAAEDGTIADTIATDATVADTTATDDVAATAVAADTSVAATAIVADTVAADSVVAGTDAADTVVADDAAVNTAVAANIAAAESTVAAAADTTVAADTAAAESTVAADTASAETTIATETAAAETTVAADTAAAETTVVAENAATATVAAAQPAVGDPAAVKPAVADTSSVNA